jgi:hypothetical protein
MDFKDYYEILGVPPDADKKVLKQTYRQLAREYHPDVNPGNKAAEEKFKTINEAYPVLSDTEKRKKYDELRAQYLQWKQAGGRQQDFDWQNWSAQPGQGVHVQYASPEDLEDLFGSASPYSDFFNNIFCQMREHGRGRGRGTTPTPPPVTHIAGRVYWRSSTRSKKEGGIDMTKGHQGESCAEAIHAVLKRGEIVTFSELVNRVMRRGSWKDETIWQHLMACVVNLPPARKHWKTANPFLFLHGDGRYELYDSQKHPKVVN